METAKNTNILIWKGPYYLWLMLGVAICLTGYIFYDGIERMVSIWSTKEEYGYGYIIPVITIFFIWLKKDRLEQIEFKGSWFGTLLLLLGMCLFILGELSTIYVVIEYSLIIVLIALALSITGWKGLGVIIVPLFLLVFMIPLPQFIYQNLSGQLQLISSELGVAFIRLFGISVFLEGNVIDLGSYRLQVVEACSGLRYLFPLASLAFIAAYIYKAPFWKRAVIFISSVPITIFMNGLRIGVIGILVDFWGTSQAEGFLHYFEGWIIFMACMMILIIEMWLLTKIGNDNRTFAELFSFDMPAATPSNATIMRRKISSSFVVSIAILVTALFFVTTLEERKEIIPARKTFDDFPVSLGEWEGKRGKLESIYIDELKFEDYIVTDYLDKENNLINFYIAYYESQRKGESAHSPRTCIPGGGWKIMNITQRTLDDVYAGDVPLVVNRIEIRKGDYRQLVYYWFQGRSRVITNEYLVKFYLFWDALTKRRTDGALVRLTSFIGPDADLAEADRRLTTFASDVSAVLGDYIPE